MCARQHKGTIEPMVRLTGRSSATTVRKMLSFPLMGEQRMMYLVTDQEELALDDV
jgi:hypothetical protein